MTSTCRKPASVAEAKPADIKRMRQSVRSPRPKYGAVKCECDGFKFDSKLERDTYLILKILHDQGIIQNVFLQQSFPLYARSGKKVCKYVADFVCETHKGDRFVVESKGKQTPVWRLKKKLFEADYPDTPIVLATSKTLGDLHQTIVDQFHLAA